MAIRHLFNPLEQVDPHDWEYSNCCVEYPSTSPPWCGEDESLVCAECIKSRFEHALGHATEWPARWGSDNLDVEHYRSILGDELYNAYTAKAAARASAPPIVPELPNGCTWGVQVQSCPGRKKVGGLSSGCNHIVCEACHTNFCFICGKEVLDRSGHWSHGNPCPRFGAKDSPRAIFDDAEPDARTPEGIEAEERGALVSAMLSWNMAMRTSDIDTRIVLHRFVDTIDRPFATGEDIRTAIAAMGINHPLSGTPDAVWYQPPEIVVRRADSRTLIRMLLEIRDELGALEAVPLPETSIFARTAPLEGLIRGPVMREFNMGAPETRDSSYRWMVAHLQDQSVPTQFGVATQENSALLSGISSWAEIDHIALVFDSVNFRFRASPLTPTSVILTVHGDVLGDLNAGLTVEGLRDRFRPLLDDAIQ